jgi:serine/threonine protein kinase
VKAESKSLYKKQIVFLVTLASKQTLKIDGLHTYNVDDLLQGGMGYVLLLSLVDDSRALSLTERLLNRSSKLESYFRYPYRKTLAAKTVKQTELMPNFARECKIWLAMQHDGIVPLLKVIDVNNRIFALMPRYSGSLRDLMMQKRISTRTILGALADPVAGLEAIYKKHKVVHQDLKPENFLYQYEDGQLRLILSDWGIANVQAMQWHEIASDLSGLSITTMGGFGTIPYMAPERFRSYVSDSAADVFSLGILFMELVSGTWPYDPVQPLAEQIISGSYYHNAQSLLLAAPPEVSRLIMSMIHPAAGKRPNYSQIVALPQNLWVKGSNISRLEAFGFFAFPR